MRGEAEEVARFIGEGVQVWSMLKALTPKDRMIAEDFGMSPPEAVERWTDTGVIRAYVNEVRRLAAYVEYRDQLWRQIVPAHFVDADMNEVDDQIASQLDEHDPFGNVLLIGDVGVGKTYTAIARAKSWHQVGRSSRIITVAQMLRTLQPGGGSKLDDYLEPDVLVLDDLGMHANTDFAHRTLFELIDGRYTLADRPIIATTNLVPAELRAHLGERSWSRLQYGILPLKLAGPDRRLPIETG